MYKDFNENMYFNKKDCSEIKQDFFKRFPFIPLQRLVDGYDEDEKNIYVTYDIYYYAEDINTNPTMVDSLLDMPITRNVWCFDKKTHKRIWVIKESPGKSSAYAGASYSDEGILGASNSDSIRFDLDPETGKISNPRFTK